ncbi:cation transport protein ChaC [Roseibium hamelinense]|uniref:glutathione-specific gamma-glutamylcyclotransferase n=1 Tax=Roseibium hamelinense TaxID=150831 RepID=A0A562SN59_9HYPH|nr:gamma-glutamylcyclotransferase [Roseibium hamelinense]MTI44045.1 gamma-glutamylcyclotransferase [Roseibium hamelinense]TWI82747.1 cation transport protein ChaC [Roseibium hamelinense]
MSDFWVFGYGSLMWNPGFEFIKAEPALLRGAHRALCVYSWVHRGTQSSPGLVFGLDRGGACRGMAYLVAGKHRDKTVSYLRAREQVTMVYLEKWRKISLQSGGTAAALTYMVDRNHPQYAGALPLQTQLDIVLNAIGQSGRNPEYVLNTAEHFKEIGIKDSGVFWLAERLAHPR